MQYLIYPTERCDKACRSCDSVGQLPSPQFPTRSDISDLITFLSADDHLELHFHASDAMFESGLLRQVLSDTHPQRAVLQTTGPQLARLDQQLRDRLDALSITLDGPRGPTDRYRDAGAYDRIIARVTVLRELGYEGRIELRLTVEPGWSIFDTITHFVEAADPGFDAVRWRLSLPETTDPRGARAVDRWLRKSYKPEISRLVQLWVTELVERDHLIPLVPFAATAHALLTETTPWDRATGARGRWTICTDGSIYGCPALRRDLACSMGTVRELAPSQLGRGIRIRRECLDCDVYGLCPGHCACNGVPSDVEALPDCGARHDLVSAIRAVLPRLETAVARGRLNLASLSIGWAHDLLP